MQENATETVLTELGGLLPELPPIQKDHQLLPQNEAGNIEARVLLATWIHTDNQRE
jgi:hypothetical protein